MLDLEGEEKLREEVYESRLTKVIKRKGAIRKVNQYFDINPEFTQPFVPHQKCACGGIWILYVYFRKSRLNSRCIIFTGLILCQIFGLFLMY